MTDTEPYTKLGMLDRMSQPTQFSVLAFGVFLFFGVHNYLQEALMSIPGFKFGVMLGYLEVFGVTVCSFLERTFVAQETGRVAPLSAYPLLTICLLASSSLSNLALNYINFPTKVVFRSCKLIPTVSRIVDDYIVPILLYRGGSHQSWSTKMVVASIVHRKIFTPVEYLLAICISLGLVLFAAADWELTPTFHPIGLAFVSMSVCADAILPNAQERLFRLGSSRLEVTVYTNIFTLIAMTLTTTVSGDLFGLIAFAQTSRLACIYMAIYTFIAYIAISIHMTVVRRFGGVAAVLVATGRKGMTLVISFLLFPKAFSWFYVVGAFLVLGGLLLSSLYKIQQKKRSRMMQPLLDSKNNDLQLHEVERDASHHSDEENGVNMGECM